MFLCCRAAPTYSEFVLYVLLAPLFAHAVCPYVDAKNQLALIPCADLLVNGISLDRPQVFKHPIQLLTQMLAVRLPSGCRCVFVCLYVCLVWPS